MDALLFYYKKLDTEEKRSVFLELLHGIVKLAKRAPEVITAVILFLILIFCFAAVTHFTH